MLQIALCDDNIDELSNMVQPINYVLKPISKEKLFFTFDEMPEQIKSEKGDDLEC